MNIRAYCPLAPEFGRLLHKHKLTINQLGDALDLFVKTEGITIFSRIGINAQGFFGARIPNWSEECSSEENVVFIPWLQIHELLEQVPPGTYSEFLLADMKYH